MTRNTSPLPDNVLAELTLKNNTVIHFMDVWKWAPVQGKLPKLPPVDIDPLYAEWQAYVEKVAAKLKATKVVMREASEPVGELGKDYVH
jgi:hypothetical protein